MDDDRRAQETCPQSESSGPTRVQVINPAMTSTASGVGRRLATSLATRRQLIKLSAATGGSAVASRYVKPAMTSLGIPAALAVSGPKEKEKEKKK